ncbi:MAG: inositol monophosphatase [Cyanobacteria bacterium]|nr:inositol monophosphatase [Cyanobacteriota bacterium]
MYKSGMDAGLSQRLQIAKLACIAAGNIQKEFYAQKILIETKSSGIDLVTEVDRRCDELIRHTIQSLSPSDQLLTEESFDEVDGIIQLDNTWVIDPLDGTTNYAHGFPHFAVSIAYVIEGIPHVGVVYDVMKNEMFHAIKGHGAFLNDKPIKVSDVQGLSGSLLATGFPYDTHIKPKDNIDYFLQFMSVCHGVRRAGAAALDLTYMACGRIDGFWELRLAPWDVAAGKLIAEEAGGKITDFFGKELNIGIRRINIVGSNGSGLHDEIVDICKVSPVALQAIHT